MFQVEGEYNTAPEWKHNFTFLWEAGSPEQGMRKRGIPLLCQEECWAVTVVWSQSWWEVIVWFEGRIPLGRYSALQRNLGQAGCSCEQEGMGNYARHERLWSRGSKRGDGRGNRALCGVMDLKQELPLTDNHGAIKRSPTCVRQCCWNWEGGFFLIQSHLSIIPWLCWAAVRQPWAWTWVLCAWFWLWL